MNLMTREYNVEWIHITENKFTLTRIIHDNNKNMIIAKIKFAIVLFFCNNFDKNSDNLL